MAALTSSAHGLVQATRPVTARAKSSSCAASATPLQSAIVNRQLCLDGSTRRQLSRPVGAVFSSLRTVARRRSCRTGSSVVASAAAAEPAEGQADSSNASSKLVLVGLFVIWYLSNIFFNIWNKQLLKLYPFPMTGTYIQLGIGSVLALLMWMFRLKSPPKMDMEQIKMLFPLACIHTLGNMLTNISVTQVAVSFTHTVKASEPFFSVLMSWLFLGTTPSPVVVATLVPIVGGVMLASLSEPSFSWPGFIAALASNITFQSRNVLSKKMMLKSAKSGTMDNINIFSVITIMAFLVATPVVLLLEGVRFTPAAVSAHLAGNTVKTAMMWKLTLLGGLMFHTYQQVSYLVLQRVTPVSHSVGNCVKRVVVIVSSIIFFRNPVSLVNGIGTALALAGVFAYSQAKPPKKGGGGD